MFGAFFWPRALHSSSPPPPPVHCLSLSVSLGSVIRTYFLEADVGESHSSEGWAHFPPHDGAVPHVALEGGGGRGQRRCRHEEGGGEGARVESHRGRRVGRSGPPPVVLDGTVMRVVQVVIVT